MPNPENDFSGELDLADISVGHLPEGWVPDVVDAIPDPSDVVDLDEDADA